VAGAAAVPGNDQQLGVRHRGGHGRLLVVLRLS
jgi:hypothetical protein